MAYSHTPVLYSRGAMFTSKEFMIALPFFNT
jgi:hypothetical protein